jgi:hypothetical protein
MKDKLLLLLLVLMVSQTSQAKPDKYWWVCYTWPDGSEQCDSKRSKVDPCSFCPCTAPDEDGNMQTLNCASEEVDAIKIKDPAYGLALDYKGNILHCTQSNTIVLDCDGITVKLCDFDTFIENFGDSAVLVYSLSYNEENNVTLVIKEENPEKPGTFLPTAEYSWTASETQLDSVCSVNSPATLKDENKSLFDRILMSKIDLFRVYPNPARENVKIQWPSKANNMPGTSFTFVLYDMAGMEVKRVKITSEITELSLENLSQEIYAYKVFLNDETKVEYNKGLITIIRD